MAPPSRDQIEQMAFMAMMDGIIHTSVPCNCATCKSDHRSKSATRPPPTKRSGSDNHEHVKSTSKSEPFSSCNHNHSVPESKSTQSTRKSSSGQSQTRSTSASANPARSDKVNALLKADSVQAVFDVLNLTTTSKEEKDLATRIQNATKDCKLYQETKDRILELCDDEDVELDAVFGLLAKFRYERNMLTTAVIKGNSEREKSLLCIQRVDHLMYMLQDVAKKKDSKGNDVMHKLGDIIMEIHDLAKTPSTLYDEFLDIKEEHFDLLNDHEDMHQKFVDVNSCHEKLHSSHDKLQTEHSKLQRDLTEAKKKASTTNGLKNDVSRLEKAMDKSRDENLDLKKEVERLNAELAKVNALKHENTQLKKKVATLSSQPAPPEETATSQTPLGKKKKGKKTLNDTSASTPAAPEHALDIQLRLEEAEKLHEAETAKLKKAHQTVTHELDVVRANLKQLDAVLRKAENARDQATEKLEVEKATSRNWKDIAKGNSSERERLQVEVDRHITRATKLQSAVEELEHSLNTTKSELVERVKAHEQIKEEIRRQSPAPMVGANNEDDNILTADTIRLLRKIRSETTQLARDIDDSRAFDGDVYTLLDVIQGAARRVVSEVERDIEEILSVKGSDPPISNHAHTQIPEAVLPFVYNTMPLQQTTQFSPHPDYSSQDLSHIPASNSLPPYRPMPPPGFESSPNPFAHNQFQPQNQHHNHNRGLDSPSAPFSRIAEPPGLSANLGFSRTIDPMSSTTPSRYGSIAPPSSSSVHSHSPLHNSHNTNANIPNPNVGVIGSRSTSSKVNTTPSPITTPAPSVSSATASVPSANPTAIPSPAGGLGNGAVGVDWNMWARSGR